MCGCGCNTCETKPAILLNESKAPKEILSEGLKYHLDNNKPLTDHLYRAGSEKYFNLFAEARSLYARNILEFSGEDLEILIETDLGHHALYEGETVPLDFPMELTEKPGVPHYTKDGKEWKGKVHKMPDGSLMSGNPHDKDGSGPNGESEELSHKEDLTETFKSSFITKQGIGYSVARFLHKPASQRIIDSLVKDLRRKQKEVLGRDTGGGFSTDLDIIYSGSFSKEEAEELLKSLNEINEGVGTYEDLKEGKKVELSKPERGGSKKFFVYVKDPKTKEIKKVSFGGTTGLKAKINDPEARQNFAKRHNCAEKRDKTKPGYWSCRLPRYSKLLGLKGSYTGFW
jgi:hypothetical protein